MTAPTQQARGLSQVAAEIDRYMNRPCSPAPAHGLTPMQCIDQSPQLKADAKAQWDAIPSTPAEIKAWMRGDPVAITDETHPEIALARAGLAAMSPEKRAKLEREWHG